MLKTHSTIELSPLRCPTCVATARRVPSRATDYAAPTDVTCQSISTARLSRRPRTVDDNLL